MKSFIGTDIEQISRFIHLLDSKPQLLQKMFFVSEYDYANSKSTPASSLAGIWCAKEAVLKAFTPVLALEVTQIEITKNPKGYPEATIHHPDILSLNYHLSISIAHTKEMATATAIVQVF